MKYITVPYPPYQKPPDVAANRQWGGGPYYHRAHDHWLASAPVTLCPPLAGSAAPSQADITLYS